MQSHQSKANKTQNSFLAVLLSYYADISHNDSAHIFVKIKKAEGLITAVKRTLGSGNTTTIIFANTRILMVVTLVFRSAYVG